jgi:cell division protein FtsW
VRSNLRRGPRRALGELDGKFLALALGMLACGLIALYSASAIHADQLHSDPWFFMKRQVLFTGAGLGLMAILSRVDYKRYREWIWWILALTGILLVAVLFMPSHAGVKRWIRFGGIGIQPAEFAKITVVLFLADYLDRKRSKIDSLRHGVVAPLAVVGVLLVLMGLAPDLGTPSLVLAVSLVMLFIGGSRWKHLGATVLAAVALIGVELMRLPYRRARLFSFLDPFADQTGAGYQLSQALLAVGSGGLFGQGPGASKMKLLYLPAPHTDFIFPIVCEEVGFAGALFVLGLFAAFVVRGMKIAKRAPDLYGALLAAGLSVLVALQAFFNIAMSVGLLPTKGLPLPFFSYGGSSMLVSLAAVGILLNISRHAPKQERVRVRR